MNGLELATSPEQKESKSYPFFDPEGTGYDYESAEKAGIKQT